MTRGELVNLLENEAHNDAAQRIASGEDAVGVLHDVIEWGSLYEDAESRAAIDTFEAILDGVIKVTY